MAAQMMPGPQSQQGGGYAPPLTAAERSARSVFVGNIPYEATEEQLKEIFIQAGPVVSFRLVYDRETGKPKGYGFCEYQDVETAQSAMRNLNNFDFHGRPLRVGVAAGEQNKEELKSMQQALGGPPVESPYGDPVEPDKAPEAISKAVASLPPEQMFELMKQMKLCIQNNPNEARNMLLQNPQLAYALLQAQIVMKIVDPQVAVAMLNRQNEQIPPLMPSDGNAANQNPQEVPANNVGPGAGPPQMELGSFADRAMQQPGFPGPAGIPPNSMNNMPNNNMPGMPMNNAQQMDMMGQRGPPGGPMGPAGRGRGGPPSLMGERPMMQEQMGPGGPMGGPRAPGPRGDMPGPRGGGHMGGGGPMGGGPGPGHGPPGRHGDMDMRSDPRGSGMGGPGAGMSGPSAGMGGPGAGMGGPGAGMGGPGAGMGGPGAGMGGPGAGMGGPGAGMGGPGMGPGMGPGGPVSNDPRHAGGRMGGPQGPGLMTRGGPGGGGPGGGAPGGPSGQNVSDQDQEKAALIMQVLQLSDQQIAMLPPEQRQSILILKEQIARSAGQGAP